MSKDFNHLREFLLPLLEERGLSIENFSRDAGISRASVYFYMSDRFRPDDAAVFKMARALGVPPEDIFKQFTPRPRGRPTHKPHS